MPGKDTGFVALTCPPDQTQSCGPAALGRVEKGTQGCGAVRGGASVSDMLGPSS